MISAGWRAVVTGGTGAVGRYLVAELLTSPLWGMVTVIGRRRWTAPLDGPAIDVEACERSGRLRQIQVDMAMLPTVASGTSSADGTEAALTTHFSGATAGFSTLGTTLADAGSAEAQRRVDVDYVAATASLARAGGVQHFAVVTSAMATSWPMRLTTYGRMKCDVEAAVAGQHFPSASIFRPGLLNRGHAARTPEKVALWVLPSIRVQAVARAMRLDAERALGSLASASGPFAGTPPAAPIAPPADGAGSSAGAASAMARLAAPQVQILRFIENATIADLAADHGR